MMELNDTQLKQLAEFTSNLSLVFIASVIAPVFSDVDKLNLVTILLGLGLGLIFLYVSLFLLRIEE